MVKFKNAVNKFKNHKKKKYHLVSVQKANDFLINFESGGNKAVDILIDKQQVIESFLKAAMIYDKDLTYSDSSCLRSEIQCGVVSGVIRMTNHNQLLIHYLTVQIYYQTSRCC